MLRFCVGLLCSVLSLSAMAGGCVYKVGSVYMVRPCAASPVVSTSQSVASSSHTNSSPDTCSLNGRVFACKRDPGKFAAVRSGAASLRGGR